jgi:lysozyme
MTDLIKGIDISIVQSKVDFQWVVNNGFKFVICRCGVGNSGIDSLYKQNIAEAKAVGLKVMAYHFVFPLPTTASQPLRDPKAQAKIHADAAGGELAACDLEWPSVQDWKKWGCSAAQIVQWTIDYLEAYEALTGIRPLVYTYPSFAQSVNLPDSFGQKYKLWIASYTAKPNIPKPWTDWVLWQDSGGDKQKLPNGIAVDTNKAKDLSLWDTQIVATPNIVASDPVPPQPSPPPSPPVIANKNFFQLMFQVFSNLFGKK